MNPWNLSKYIHIVSIILMVNTMGFTSAKRTMMGEPLNPGNYEDGIKMVIATSIQSDMNYNDGTMDDIRPDKSIKPSIRSSKTIPWPNGDVPYLLDSAFSSEEKDMIAKAIATFHELTCVRVKVRTDEKDYVVVKKNTESGTCSSQVGFQGGRQSVILAERCLLRPGSIVHEFMHVLGFHHEQCRRDRDQFVTVFYDRIVNGAKGNFNETDTPGNLYSPYDTLSVTHYSKFAFSINRKPTMLPKDGNGQLGQRMHLTKYDIQKINGFYDCANGKKASKPVFQNSSRLSTSGLESGSRCVDMDRAYCKLWSRLGHCKKSYMFMAVFCKFRCKQCDKPCRNMNPKCYTWAQKGYCSKHADYMHQYCQKSCKICV